MGDSSEGSAGEHAPGRAWHLLTAQAVAEALEVDPSAGLSLAQVRDRLARHGPNALPEGHGPSALSLAGRQLRSFLVLLLLLAALLSFVLGERADALAILTAVLLNAIVGFVMDFRAERALASLQALSAPSARTRRAGQQAQIPARELVPGDVVLVEAGDRVPADGRLVDGALEADESLLTGESVPVPKHCAPLTEPHPETAGRGNELFAGAMITRGAGTMIVTETGGRTEVGHIGRLLSEAPSPASPLAERLDALGRYLVWMISALAGVIIAIGLLQGREFWPLVETAVVLAIAAIPEGLPAVATLALAAGARRLARRGVLLRKLGALEAMGSVSTLCVDKTGTLTANAMTARAVVLAGCELDVTGEGWEPSGAVLQRGRPPAPECLPALAALARACQACNDAVLEQEEGRWHIHGDPSEGALLVLAAKLGSTERPRRLETIPPGENHPWMVAVCESEGARIAFVKGAPEQVLSRCVSIRGGDSTLPFSEEQRARCEAANQGLAGRAMRVLALAMRRLPEGPTGEDLESGWEWLGLVGLADPPRPTVRAVLAQAHRAGIRTVMITGDQRITAAAIARELDLAGGAEPKLCVGSDPAVDADVYARATPAGKLRLVQGLQARGELVAMTGDGVNDAPALRTATVGIAMGRGADVAKEAADAVLTDERLESLVTGIREGRAVFLNIQKGLDFLLTCSMTTLLVVLVTTASGLPLPLLPLQILYLNLLMHTFPALGLTLEPASPEVMTRPPLPRRASLLPPGRLATILSHSVIMSVATLSIGAWGLHHEGESHARTLVFATVATTLLLHVFSDRSVKPFGGLRWGGNPMLFAFLAAAVGMQLTAIYVPAISRRLDMTPFNPDDWLAILIAAFISLVAVETSKLALPPEPPPKAAR
ncbi:MAG TPA: cation-transporting P-type ATPase [Myxococcales bacterium]|jgi:Ca2+-transporting ATPase